MSGPSSGAAGAPSGNFTVTLGSGSMSGSATITPHSSLGGTIAPGTIAISVASPAATFTVTDSAGSDTITTTNDRSLTNPSGKSYTASSGGATVMAMTPNDATPVASAVNTFYGVSAPPATAISATFNQSITPGNIIFSLTDNSGNPVSTGAVSYNSGSKTATWTPAAPLAFSATHTATVSGVTASPVVWTFTTDAKPPDILITYPATSATSVDVTTPKIAAYFDQTLYPYYQGNHTGDSGMTVVQGSTAIVQRVDVGDLTGYLLSSSTGSYLYKVATHSGVNCTLAAPWQEASGTISWSAILLPNYPSLVLTYSGGTVPGGCYWDLTNNCVVFIPASPLAYNTVYTATVTGAVNAVATPMASSYSWSFTTIHDSGVTPVASVTLVPPTIPAVPASLAAYIAGMTIPTRTNAPRLWFTAATLAAAQSWYTANQPYGAMSGGVPNSTDPQGNAFVYLMTGNTTCGMIAVNYVLTTTIVAAELTSAQFDAVDDYRWYPWVPIVFDWCYALFTPEQRALIISRYNNYSEIALSESGGTGPGDEGSDYFTGYMANALNWAVATWDINPMAQKILLHCHQTRWIYGLLPWMTGTGAPWYSSIGVYYLDDGRGGVPTEGSGYGRAWLQYMCICYGTLKNMGLNVPAQTTWFQETILNQIYTTYQAQIGGNWIEFGYGDDDNQETGTSANWYYNADFMNTFGNWFAGTNVAAWARTWLNTIVGSHYFLNSSDRTGIDPWVAATDPGGSALAYTGLPLDYYAPGSGFFYIRDSWSSTGVSILLQLSQPDRGDHWHADWGSWHMMGGGQKLSLNHAGYTSDFADGSNSNASIAQNSIAYAGTTPFQGFGTTVNYGSQKQNPTVLAIESAADHAYAAVDMSSVFQHPSIVGNPDAGTTIREFVFARAMATLIIVDRLQSTSTGVNQTFVMHCSANPTLTDGTHVTYTIGGQQVWLTTLATLSSGATSSYTVVAEGNGATGGSENVWRIQDAATGSLTNAFVHIITTSASGTNPVSIALTSGGGNWIITLTKGTATAVLTVSQVWNTTGGSFGYAPSGAVTSATLATSIQPFSVSSAGPVWDPEAPAGEVEWAYNSGTIINSAAYPGSQYQPSNLYDGDYSTIFASSNSSGSGWVGIDLGAGSAAALTEVLFSPRTDGGFEASAAAMALEYADSPGGTWTQIAVTPAYFPFQNVMNRYRPSSADAHRCWRLRQPAYLYCQLSELRWQGTPATNAGWQPARPVLDPPAGKFSAGQDITITCATTDAVIYYTVDGSTPTNASTLYSGPISLPAITSNTTYQINAVAYLSFDWQPSGSSAYSAVSSGYYQPQEFVPNSGVNTWGTGPVPAPWYADNGFLIEAHGGGILWDPASSKYYWYGCYGSALDARGIYCYSSTDLYNWHFEGQVLPIYTGAGSLGDQTRPHVLYNPAASTSAHNYVMWVHNGTATGGSALVATCSTPNGAWTYLSGMPTVPAGNQIGDINLFQDTIGDGTWYLIAANSGAGNSYIQAWALDPATDNTSFKAGPIGTAINAAGSNEAPVVFCYNSRYWLLNSAEYYYTNPVGSGPIVSYCSSTTLAGLVSATETSPYASPVNVMTHAAQTTCVFAPQGLNGFILVLDRWTPSGGSQSSNLNTARFVWFPVPFAAFSGGTLAVPTPDTWDLTTIS